MASGETRFDVHYQASPPRPSWTAWKRWTRGILTVRDDHAIFEARGGDQLDIRNVSKVSQPSRAELYRQHDISWPVNTWIAVSYSDSSGTPATAYFNDGRLFGHYLSHRALLRSLTGLVGK